MVDVFVLGVYSAVAGVLEAGALLLVSGGALALTAASSEVKILGIALGLQSSMILCTILALARAGFAVLGARANASMVYRVHVATVGRIVAAHLRASLSGLRDERVGDLQRLVTLNCQRVTSVIISMGQALAAGINILVLMILSITLSPAAMVLLVLGGILMIASLRPLARRARRLSGPLALDSATLSGALTEAARLKVEIRSFSVERPVESFLMQLTRVTQSRVKKVRVYSLSLPAVYQSTIIAISALLILIGSARESGGGGDFAAVTILMLRCMTLLQVVNNANTALAESSAFLDDLMDTIRSLESSSEPVGGLLVEPIESVELVRAEIVTDGRFHFGPIDLRVESSKSLSILGSSGGGKSTLLDALLGLRPLTHGNLLVNGVKISEHDQGELRRRIGYVPQSAVLIAGTLRENVVFWREGVDDGAVIAACRSAGLGDAVDGWPDGLDTDLGEAGSRLSGGQRQRICIARALVGGPDLLVLDEPTSSLDLDSAEVVRSTLCEIGRSVCVILVTHDEADVFSPGRVAILENGRLDGLFDVSEWIATSRSRRSNGGVD